MSNGCLDKVGEKAEPTGTWPSLEDGNLGEHHEVHDPAERPKPFTTLAAMGVGHSISNTAITVIVGLSSGISFGGGPLYFWSFLLMALVALCVAVSLGELSSAMPHAGGQYFWVAQLCPPNRFRRLISYMVGILAWASAVCTGTSVCLAVPQMVLGMISLKSPDFVQKPWMLFVGFQMTNWVTFTFNCFERILPLCNKSILAFTVSALIVIFISLLAAPRTRAPPRFVFLDIWNESGWASWVAFLIGMNGTNWGFSCLDVASHLADEVPDPRRDIPKALLSTVALGTFTGIPITLALFFAISNMDNVVTSGVPSLEILYQAFNGSFAAAIGLQTLVLISATGAIVGIHTWQSRMAYAFSRDGGFPFSKHMGKIAPSPFSTPVWAHVWSSVWISLLGCLSLGSTTALNSFIAAGILLQYITYSTAIVLLLLRGRHNLIHGPFWFPRIGYIANIVTVAWCVISVIFYCFPYALPVQAGKMNYVSCVLVGIILYALAYWVFYGRTRFVIPASDTLH